VSDRFAAGEVCLLVDARGRRYLVDLQVNQTFEYHAGTVGHNELIGSANGCSVRTNTGARLVALRPRLADYILRMKRGPQVVYPKDIGPILMWGDIAAGMTVLEAGTGSGALTLALARAVGPQGRVVSVERRDDHARHADKVIRRLLGDVPEWVELRVGDVEEAVAEVMPERLVLDLPEPWSVIEAAAGHMAEGGVVSVYVPTVPQIARTRDAFRRTGRFADLMTFEVLHREWAADGRSVRPEHQMVGHTGFITVARHVEDLAADDAGAEDD
jgi:tRNA (adenine57-N1/adenine58-N1)-methyltransferase